MPPGSETTEAAKVGSGKGRLVPLLSLLGLALATGPSAAYVAGGQPPPQLTVVVRRAVPLLDALPQILRASLLAVDSFAVFSDRTDEDFVSLGIFTRSGALVKSLAGNGVSTGLAHLTSLQVSQAGTLWATTLIPAEVAQLNENGLLSVRDLQRLKLAYSLALDEAHGYLYVGGCAPPEHTDVDSPCLLVHQFELNGMKFRRSFLQMDPQVLRNAQVGIQWVHLDVDARGIVWVIDSPAFTLYSIDASSGSITPHPIRSRLAKPAGKLDILAGDSYVRSYIENSSSPDSVFAVQDLVVVAIRRPGDIGTAGYLLEIFDHAGAQIGMDVPAPGKLVGKYGARGMFFGRSAQKGATLIQGVLTNSRPSGR
jgi:hypothetical protein